MKIDFLTLFPELFTPYINTGITKRARLCNVELVATNIRDYSLDKHHRVDEPPFGGGAGLVMKVDVVTRAIRDLKTKDSFVILTSPRGVMFTQEIAHQLSQKPHLIIVCGHYEGIDERVSKDIDLELSIGDYVLTGGEIPALAIADSVIRLIPGVISGDSHQEESFYNGLLEYPHYTRPLEFEGEKVPEVLLSGHHEMIRKWRLKESLRITSIRRPDLLFGRDYTKEEQKALAEINKENKKETN